MEPAPPTPALLEIGRAASQSRRCQGGSLPRHHSTLPPRCPQWRRLCLLCPDRPCSRVRPTPHWEPFCASVFQACGIQGCRMGVTWGPSSTSWVGEGSRSPLGWTRFLNSGQSRRSEKRARSQNVGCSGRSTPWVPEGGRSPADGSVVHRLAHRLAGPGWCWSLSHHPLKLRPVCFFVKCSILIPFLSLFNVCFVG